MTATRKARSGLPWLGAGLLLLGAYLLAPALVLLRLDRAVRAGDSATVTRLVDWTAVRHSLAAEIAGGILDPPAPGPRHAGPYHAGPQHADAGTGLLPFGFSFVSRITDTEMATRLTPRGLIRLARADAGADGPALRPRLAGIRFDGPWRIAVRLRMAGQPQPVRLRLRLERGGWKVTGVWLPPELLRRAAHDTDGGRAEPGRGTRALPGNTRFAAAAPAR